MLRSAAKNHAAVAVLSSPAQYAELLAELAATGGCTTRALRRRLAAAVYATTAAYDSAISRWFAGQLGGQASVFTRTYERQIALKYGCNPHQNPAFVGRLADTPAMPFEVLNGTPGASQRLWCACVRARAGGCESPSPASLGGPRTSRPPPRVPTTTFHPTTTARRLHQLP